MARHFQPAPVLFKPPMSETPEIGCSDNQASPMGTQACAALAQQIHRIHDMLDYVVQRNDIVLGNFRHIGDCASEYFKSLASAASHRGGIRVHTRYAPA